MTTHTDSRLRLLPAALGLVLGLAFLLSACQPTPPATPTTSTQAPTAVPTDTPLPPTTTPTPTHTPLPPTATPPLSPSPLPPVSPSPFPSTDTPTPATDDAPMVRVPAGEFIMGSSYEEFVSLHQQLRQEWDKSKLLGFIEKDWFRDELPQRTIYLDEFYIDKYEVTIGRYRRCAEAGVCRQPPDGSGERDHYYDDPAYDDYPVVYVSWDDAQTYCHWVGKRLPTEAEWEKAARGTDGRWWPWGNEWAEGRANASQGYTDTMPVGSFPEGASPYGVMDMIGNVREWVDDWYDAYLGNSYQNEDFGRQYKVVRGGLMKDPILWNRFKARVATRRYFPPTDMSAHQGFRCLAGPPKPTPEPTYTPTPTGTPDVSRWTEMILIPTGEFLMGAGENDPLVLDPGEKPQHTVYLDAYYIDKHEVTNAQYVAFLNDLGANRWACRGYDCIDTEDGKYSERLGHILYADGRYQVEAGYERYPVVEVTWYGADEYCRHYGLRLPTEAEWEKAARGSDGRLYPWGDEWDPDKVVVARTPGGAHLSPVGSHPEGASPYGVLDMSGSVWEWVADWADAEYYSRSPYRNPQGPDSGSSKVARGGGYQRMAMLTA